SETGVGKTSSQRKMRRAGREQLRGTRGYRFPAEPGTFSLKQQNPAHRYLLHLADFSSTLVDLPSITLVQALPSSEISYLKVYDLGDNSLRMKRPFMVLPPKSLSLVQVQVSPETVPFETWCTPMVLY